MIVTIVASAIEAMGLSLPGSSSTPAEDEAKLQECFNAGQAIHRLLHDNLKPLDILSKQSIENAIILTMALGGKPSINL